jgi:hypothetical protein
LSFRLRSRNAFRRQTGGDVFGAFDFVCVAMLEEFLLHRGPADGVGASLGGFAVGTLRLGVTQPAARAKTHATAVPGKISFTHN